MKHTQGEWDLRYPKNVGSCEITVDGIVSIASIHNAYDNLEEQEANAKLISAAPKLLDALEIALNILECKHGFHKGLANTRSIEEMKEAIKQATE